MMEQYIIKEIYTDGYERFAIIEGIVEVTQIIDEYSLYAISKKGDASHAAVI